MWSEYQPDLSRRVRDTSGREDIGVTRLRPAAPGLSVVAPSRVLDTRSGPRLAAGTITRVATGAPAGTTAVLINLTMTDATTAGYITADKCTTLTAGPQTKSNGNYTPGQNIANGTVVGGHVVCTRVGIDK